MPLINDTSAPFGDRSLAAIMFTDVVNYSGLVGSKEDRVLAAVHRDFGIMKGLIGKAEGRVIKSTGDGLMILFQSAVNAVSCALEIQAGFARTENKERPGIVLQHRIGIHLGDVFLVEDDVYGNGVNVAARLQNLAEPGGLSISQTVFDVVRGKLTFEFRYIGPQDLNHIRDAVNVYLVPPKVGGAAPRIAVATEVDALRSAAKPALVAPDGNAKAHISASVTLGGPLTRSRPVSPRGELRKVAILGDFSGRATRPGLEPGALAKVFRVDVDSWESVFRQMDVRLSLPGFDAPGHWTDLSMATPQDFHPDQLLRNYPEAARLMGIRQRLASPGTAAGAARELVEVQAAHPRHFRGAPTGGPRPAGPVDVGGTELRSPQEIVARLIQRQLTPGPSVSPQQLQDLDALICDHLRAVIQHADFKRCEALWAGVDALVTDFGASEQIELWLADVNEAELRRIVGAGGVDDPLAVLAPALPRDLNLVVTDLTIGATRPDLDLIGLLGLAASERAAQVLAGASPQLANTESFGHGGDPAGWNKRLWPDIASALAQFRASPAASHVVLAAPRLLMRPLYSRKSNPVSGLAFEELLGRVSHEMLLWGCPSFAVARVMLGSFLEGNAGVAGSLSGAPICVARAGQEELTYWGAECLFPSSVVEVLEKKGISPVVPIRNRSTLVVNRVTTFAAK